MYARRHMYEYGTTSAHFGAISVACRKHANMNPRAIMYGRPMTIEDHQNSRMIYDPFHLFDCCLETDGGAAIVISSAERAKDMRQRPVYVSAVAQRPRSPHHRKRTYFPDRSRKSRPPALRYGWHHPPGHPTSPRYTTTSAPWCFSPLKTTDSAPRARVAPSSRAAA